MSTAQAAEYLGITRDALHARIRVGEFEPPDVLIGDRFQGWSPETVEKFRQKQAGIGYFYDTQGLVTVITQIRTTAERIRTYGNHLGVAADGFTWTVPENLHVVAARLESSLRGRLALDAENAAVLAAVDTEVAAAWRSEEPPAKERADDQTVTRVDLTIDPVETFTATHATRQDRTAQLLNASQELAAVIWRLPKVFDNPVSRLSARAIAVEKSVIDNKLDKLTGPE